MKSRASSVNALKTRAYQLASILGSRTLLLFQRASVSRHRSSTARRRSTCAASSATWPAVNVAPVAGGSFSVGTDFSTEANLMSNDQVWPAMAKAFQETLFNRVAPLERRHLLDRGRRARDVRAVPPGGADRGAPRPEGEGSPALRAAMPNAEVSTP